MVVFILQGLSQLHFYKFYLEFGFLRKTFKHVSQENFLFGLESRSHTLRLVHIFQIVLVGSLIEQEVEVVES